MSDLISREDTIREIVKRSATDFMDVEAIATVIHIVNQMPSVEVPRWISCSERLPNTLGCYLVWRPHFFSGEIGMPAICYFDGQNTWHDSYGVDFTKVLNAKDVTAWMPLPSPYEPQESEDKE